MTVLIEAASPDRATLPIGTAAPQLQGLLGVDGNRYGFESYPEAKALVLIFSSNRCPTAKAYGPRMNELQDAYGPHGVQVLAINSNDPHLYPDESLPGMVERAREDAYTFPYVVDEGQSMARSYGAACTFHVFLLDQDRRVRYQGRFDDSRLEDRVRSHDLINAIEDVLAGRDVQVPVTRPFGCSLDIV